MNPSRRRPALSAIGIHSAVLVALMLGVRNDTSGPSPGTVIYAELLQFDERNPAADESPSEPPNEAPSAPREDRDSPEPPEPPEPESALVRTEQGPSALEQAATDPILQESVPAPIEPPQEIQEPIAAPVDAPAPQRPLLVEDASADPAPRGTPVPAPQRTMT